VAKDLLAAGLHCQTLDALPCALARAVQMCDPSADEPIAALDIGNTSASLTIVREGRPVFCRLLRSCGLKSLMQEWRQRLGVDSGQCRQLLSRYGLAAEQSCSPAAIEIFSRPLAHVVDELNKTFQFLALQAAHWSPARIWMFGGGAMIRGVAEFFTQKTGLPTKTWRLSGAEATVLADSDPLFGASAGLSVLAWEADQCT
jgi:Tfp pilus assembly PilM family ATPase